MQRVETLLQWQIENLPFSAQAYETLKLGPCILPFEFSAYILKVDVSIVKAHRVKPTRLLHGLLAEAVNMESHV